MPLGYWVDDDGRVFVMAAKAGALTAGQERDRLYAMISDGTSEYEKNADRAFPVIVLEGVPAPA